MAVRDHEGNELFLQTERARCYFLWHVYFKENFRPTTYLSFQDGGFLNWVLQITGELLNSRNVYFTDPNHMNSECLKYIKAIEQESKSGLIPLEQFSWMKGHRACYFVWLNLKQFIYSSTNPMSSIPINCYHDHGLPAQPTSTDERFKTIIQFFDLYRAPKELKLKEIERLKTNWLQIFEQGEPLAWLDKNNEEQCIWAWEYCKKKTPINAITSIHNIHPVNEIEAYHAVYAFLDSWNQFAEKKLFSLKIGKARAQNKLRKSKADQKPLNTYLEAATKKQLITLTKEQDKTIFEMINYLIRKEYNNTRSS